MALFGEPESPFVWDTFGKMGTPHDFHISNLVKPHLHLSDQYLFRKCRTSNCYNFLHQSNSCLLMIVWSPHCQNLQWEATVRRKNSLLSMLHINLYTITTVVTLMAI